MRLGIQELLIILTLLIVYAVPVAAAVWIIVTLNRISKTNAAICKKLDSIEQALRRDSIAR